MAACGTKVDFGSLIGFSPGHRPGSAAGAAPPFTTASGIVNEKYRIYIIHRIDSSPLDIRVLVLAGEEDRQFAVHICRKMADATKGSGFVVLPHTAPLASSENPALVNAEIDKFLNGWSSGKRNPK
jgi:pimeloyl-ACP methyl ester carboxylesterase